MKYQIETAYEVINYFKKLDSEQWPSQSIGRILVDYVDGVCDMVSTIITSQAHLTELNPHPFLKHEQSFEVFMETIGGHYSEVKS